MTGPSRGLLAAGCLGFAAFFAASVGAAEPGPGAKASFSAGDIEFFEKKVRPVLARHCYECHSTRAKKLKAGLYLDSRAGAIKGGESGEALLPGKPDESLLVEAIRYESLEMPPRGRLPQETIAILVKWVERGAPWPDEAAPTATGEEKVFDWKKRRADHWAWQPIRTVEPPVVQDVSWPRNAIDQFILRKLQEKGLSPAPETDRRTLIRRLSFDLIGLPPSPEEVEQFLNDRSDEAYPRLVERLLSSEHFGEKWARHWMDLTRYAESYGHEFDYSIRHTHNYRDYLIRAFQDDVPYDQIIREHLAGDLLDPPRHHPTDGTNESIVATGFWYMHEQTHAPTDVRQHEADRIDNQIDVMCKTFMGLTVSCARCHDHRFDAIATADYYGLAGILQSSRQQDAYLDPGGRIETAVQSLQSIRDEADTALAAFEKSPRESTESADAVDSELFEDFGDGRYDGWSSTGHAWGDAPTGLSQWNRASRRAVPVRPGLAHSGMLSKRLTGTLRSPEFDLNHPQIGLLVFGKGTIRLIIDGFTMEPHNGLLFKGTRIDVNTKGKWQWVRLGGDLRLYAAKGNHRGHLALIDDDPNASLAVDEIRFTSGPLPHETGANSPTKSLSESADGQFAEFSTRMEKAARTIPQPRRVLAITDGSAEDGYVHIRGSWANRGPTVGRRLLVALAGEEQPPIDSGSGRLELAQRILHPSNPFPARVAVNRLWHHLIGRGIVPTVDDFGEMGQAPSHPELLDWLATDFVREGWSLKQTIRTIVNSSTYRMSSAADHGGVAARDLDPDNLLLTRMSIRRLPAESIRDAILAVSGRLDRKLYGPSVPVHLTSFMEGRGRPKGGPLDGAGRRSIYLATRRNFLPPMLLTFDLPVPFSTMGRRTVSNVPSQALALMNDPFVVGQARLWAEQVVARHETPAERIEAMFVSAFAVPPSDNQLERIGQFGERQAELYNAKPDDVRVWTDVAHMLFNMKQFIYLN